VTYGTWHRRSGGGGGVPAAPRFPIIRPGGRAGRARSTALPDPGRSAPGRTEATHRTARWHWALALHCGWLVGYG